MKQYPEPVVGAFIFNTKNQLLLVQSRKWPGGVWHVPGGHIEIGESIKKAVVREVKEEVGIDVKFIEVFSIEEAIFPEAFTRKKHFIFLECRCVSKDSHFSLDNNEIQNAKWFRLEEALKLKNLESYTRKSINILVNKHK